MEFKAYVEGIRNKWWIILLLVAIGFLIGRAVGNSQNSDYTAATTIQVNDTLLASNFDSTGTIQLNIPKAVSNQIITPAILNYISKHYPRLTRSDLTKNIVISSDVVHQVVVITVTDISQAAAADIANFVAQNFVDTQNASLSQQLDYFQSSLSQKADSLTSEINKLNTQIGQLTPPPVAPKNYVPPTAQARQTLAQDQYQLNQDQRDLYIDKQALTGLQQTRPLFSHAYVILRPATESGAAVTVPLSVTIYELIGLGAGLLAAIVLIMALEYFSPFVRHGGEILRIVGFPLFAELPRVYGFDQRRILQKQKPVFFWRATTLQVICAAIGACAMREKGHTVLLTSPRQKRDFAATLGTSLAMNGYRTLLIDLDFQQPTLHQKIRRTGPGEFVTSNGVSLTFVNKTNIDDLYLLPGKAMFAQNMPVTSELVMNLLPELQNMFDMIVIDAPPLNHGDTHLFAKIVKQPLLLVKKRRDSLKLLEVTHVWCGELKLNMQSLLLS
jgi:capsular polysaccharide biosynthesis protein